MRSCEILFNGISAGLLVEEGIGKYVFTYHSDYLKASGSKPVSLIMPLREEPFYSDYLFSPFANMLSEGSNRKMQSQLLHIDEDDDFGILLATCQFDTIGAITVKPIIQ